MSSILGLSRFNQELENFIEIAPIITLYRTNINPRFSIISSAKKSCPMITNNIAVVIPLGTLRVINSFSLKVKFEFAQESSTDMYLIINKIRNKAKEFIMKLKSKCNFIINPKSMKRTTLRKLAKSELNF